MNHSRSSESSEVVRQLAHSGRAEMSATMALMLQDRSDRGQYALPHSFKEDYQEAIQGKPDLSSYNLHTPKMWPLKALNRPHSDRNDEKQRPPQQQNIGNHNSAYNLSVITESSGGYPGPGSTMSQSYRGYEGALGRDKGGGYCSKSLGGEDSAHQSITSPISSVFATSGKYGFGSSAVSRLEDRVLKEQPLTALQQTLLTCGKIHHTNRVISEPIHAKVEKAETKNLQHMYDHALWLQEKELKRSNAKAVPSHNYSPQKSTDDADSIFGGESITKFSKSKFNNRKGRHATTNTNSSLTRRQILSKVKHSRLYSNELPPEGVKEARSIKGYAEANELEDRLEKLHASLASGNIDHQKSRVSYTSTCDVKSIMSELSRPSYSGVVLRNIGSSAPDSLGNPYRGLNAGKHMEARGSPSLDSLSIGYSKSSGRGSQSILISGGASRRTSSGGGSGSGSGSIANLNKNNRIYAKSQKVCGLGSYVATIRSASTMGNSLGSRSAAKPTLKDVTESTALLSKKQLLAYDTRIVETGAILKALQSLNHKTPGLTAIITFHRGMVASAIINPNPYFISRAQLRDVIYTHVPWMNKDSVGRLVSSYDPFQTGFVRYIRLSASIIAGNRPSMSGLISSLNNGSKAGDPHGVGMVLALIFGLYQDCEGQQATGTTAMFNTGGPGDITQIEVKGMKLVDIREALSSCVCSASDEVSISECADIVIQELFDQMQSGGLCEDSMRGGDSSAVSTISGLSQSTFHSDTGRKTAKASVMLGHGALSSMANVSIVSQDDFTRAVLENRHVYNEFSEQLLRFRGLVAHFAHVGSIAYADAQHEKTPYGTRNFS